MAHPPHQSAENPSTFMLKCPNCRWQAAAPPDWVAPFAVCPRCETKIANPDADRAGTARTSGSRRPGRQRRKPAGYEFTYSETARRRNDAWIKNLVMVAMIAAAVGGSFWAITKQRANSKGSRNKSVYELLNSEQKQTSPGSQTPFSNPDDLDLSNSVAESQTSVEWDSSSVFQAPASTSQEDSLWNATGPASEPLTPSSSSEFSDPAIPSFEGFK